jgi:WD40 repeat protein
VASVDSILAYRFVPVNAAVFKSKYSNDGAWTNSELQWLEGQVKSLMVSSFKIADARICWLLKLLLGLCLTLAVTGCNRDHSTTNVFSADDNLSSSAVSELPLVFRLGKPISDHQADRERWIEFASWVDDERIVYLSRGSVTCISTKDRRVQWVVRAVGKIKDWSVSRGAKRLAILSDNFVTSVIDCSSGKIIVSVDSDRLAQVLGVEHVTPTHVAISPTDGRLFVCSFSQHYGRNGYILDSSCTELLSTFAVDAAPRRLSVSPSGRRLAVVAAEDVLCVTDLIEDRDVFFQGSRVRENSGSRTRSIDSPFFSHLHDNDGEELVYSLDNSWGTGEVFIHNIATNKVHSFDGKNGHIELDVSFANRRLVLTGTSTDLTVLDFDGNMIAERKNAAMNRITSVEFSPSEDRILIGSWDNTLAVFSMRQGGQ